MLRFDLANVGMFYRRSIRSSSRASGSTTAMAQVPKPHANTMTMNSTTSLRSDTNVQITGNGTAMTPFIIVDEIEHKQEEEGAAGNPIQLE